MATLYAPGPEQLAYDSPRTAQPSRRLKTGSTEIPLEEKQPLIKSVTRLRKEREELGLKLSEFNSSEGENVTAVQPTPSSSIISIPGLFNQRLINGSSINTLQEWQGVVDEVGEADFTAQLADLTDRTREVEFAEIPFTEVDLTDREKIRPGAIFHMIIGYSRRSGRTQTRETLLYFRRFTPKTGCSTVQLADLLDEFPDED